MSIQIPGGLPDRPYNQRDEAPHADLVIDMTRRAKKDLHAPEKGSFGDRLRRIRQARGFSQEQLGREVGISQRMMAYYENHAEKAPAHHLMRLADILRVSIDELVGYRTFSEKPVKRNSRLWARLRKVESLPAKEQKKILDHIQDLVDKQRATGMR